MSKPITFTVSVPTYKTYVNVYISDDQSVLDDWNSSIIKRQGHCVPLDESFDCQGRSYYIYIDEHGYRCADVVMRKDNLTYGLISHELFHVVSHIMEYVNVSLSDSSEEAYAHLITYLVDSVMKELTGSIEVFEKTTLGSN